MNEKHENGFISKSKQTLKCRFLPVALVAAFSPGWLSEEWSGGTEGGLTKDSLGVISPAHPRILALLDVGEVSA